MHSPARSTSTSVATGRPRRGRQATYSCAILAVEQGNRRHHRRHGRPGTVRAELRRRVQGRRAGTRSPRPKANRSSGTRPRLHQEPALLRRHDHAVGTSTTSMAHACSACSATRSPPTTSRRRATSRRIRRRAASCRPTRQPPGLQQLRLASRQRRRDGARHLRQHPHQEPDVRWRGRRQHAVLRQGRRLEKLRSTTRQ